jgi:ADP-dependent phosphofructokinase/glucokinase
MVIDITKRRLISRMDKAIDSGKVPLTNKQPDNKEYTEGLERIKESIERINALLKRLKEEAK